MTHHIDSILSRLPDLDKDRKALVIISGGLDSTTALKFLVTRYSSINVRALSFDYGQKQKLELTKAGYSTHQLNVEHEIISLGLLNKIAEGISANVDPNIKMPTIQEVIGHPQPITEVPFRNMIMLSIACAYAQKHDCQYIITGVQATDQYAYWDTTSKFIDSMNGVISQNRLHNIKIIAPFSDLTKTDEINLLLELDGNVNLLEHTLTCYNPTDEMSCGYCPSCSERIRAFLNVGIKDPVPYSRVDIPWPIHHEKKQINP